MSAFLFFLPNPSFFVLSAAASFKNRCRTHELGLPQAEIFKADEKQTYKK